MDADTITAILQLQAGGTCGFTRSTFVAPFPTSPEDRPARPGGSALYFLVTPQASVQLHAIASDQMYHHYSGDPLEVFQITGDGRLSRALVGNDLTSNMAPQLSIPAGTYHTARTTGTWSLLGTTLWPALADGEVDIPDVRELARRLPQAAELLNELHDSTTHFVPSSLE